MEENKVRLILKKALLSSAKYTGGPNKQEVGKR